MLLSEKYEAIKLDIAELKSKDPIQIVNTIMNKDYISMHGPEHHFVDGASFLVAYKNAGGEIELSVALEELAKRTILMPGAMCGNWGICGATASIGAALSVINKCGPLSSDVHYKENMQFTSSVIRTMSEIGGPRCCKRNAYLTLREGIRFAKEKYNIAMEVGEIQCVFSSKNAQCIRDKCPFFSL